MTVLDEHGKRVNLDNFIHKYIKENLRVEVAVTYNRVTVNTKLKGEIINTTWDTIN